MKTYKIDTYNTHIYASVNTNKQMYMCGAPENRQNINISHSVIFNTGYKK